MPGIAGFIDFEGILPETSLATMLQIMQQEHDAKPEYLDLRWGGIGIVHYKNQNTPILSHDSPNSVMLGEFEAGTGIDLNTYQDISSSKLVDIRGGFVWACLDQSTRSINIVNDHFGRYPLYIARLGSAFVFASQIKAIVSLMNGQQALDLSSVATLLTIGEVIGNKTLIQGIETLPPATHVRLSQSGIVQKKYWQYEYRQNNAQTWSDAVDNVGEHLKTAVQRAVQGHNQVAVPLSGGLDSRFILALANSSTNCHAYTWGVNECWDLRYAETTAKLIGCAHQGYVFEPDYLINLANHGVWLTEGQLPIVHFHVLPYINTVKSHNESLVLDGFFGDIILGGNSIQNQWLNNPIPKIVARQLWSWRLSSLADSWLIMHLQDHFTAAEHYFESIYFNYSGQTSMDQVMSFLLDNRARRVTTGGVELFRSTIQVKQPFLDIDFQNTVNTVPHEWKQRHRFYVDVLKRFAPQAASAPWQRTGLPADMPYGFTWLSMASQRGYKDLRKVFPLLPDLLRLQAPSDFNQWLKGPLKHYAESIIFDDKTKSRGVIPHDVLIKAWQRHLTGQANYTGFIGSALTLELFCRLFIDNFNSK